MVRFTGALFLTFMSQKQGIIYCLHWDLALTISAHVLVDGVELWIHQKMIFKLFFLALLVLLKQQQAACSGSLEKGPKTCIPSMCVGNDEKPCLPSSSPDQDGYWTSSRFPRSHQKSLTRCSCCIPQRMKHKKPQLQSQVLKVEPAWLVCGRKRRKKRETCQWGCWMKMLCTPGFFKAWHTFLENRGSGVLFPGIPQLSVSWVSECSLPPCM